MDTSQTRCCPLIEWQQILGWINWALNVYPLAQLALQLLYVKISGKQIPHAPVFLNRDVIHHLNWLADMFDLSDSIHVLDAIKWGRSDADLIVYCNALLTGLGFT